MSEQHEHQGLIRYDAMCAAIAACVKVDEIKNIRDHAIALEHYSRVAQNKEAEAQCAEIRIRAEHKVGLMLKRMRRSQGRRSDLPSAADLDPTVSPRGDKSFAEQIDEAGISPKQAENWQKLADVPEEQLDQSLAQSFMDREVPTTRGVITAAHPPQPKTIEATTPSDWLCNWLLGFEEEGMADADPHALLADMTPTQHDKVLRLAPSVSDWLWQLQPPAPEPDAA